MQVEGRQILSWGSVIMTWGGSAVIDLPFGEVNVKFAPGAITMAAWYPESSTIQLEGLPEGQPSYSSLVLPMSDGRQLWMTFGVIPLPNETPMAQLTFNAGY